MKEEWAYTNPQLKLMDWMSRMDAPAYLCDAWLHELFGTAAVEKLSTDCIRFARTQLGTLRQQTQAWKRDMKAKVKSACAGTGHQQSKCGFLRDQGWKGPEDGDVEEED